MHHHISHVHVSAFGWVWVRFPSHFFLFSIRSSLYITKQFQRLLPFINFLALLNSKKKERRNDFLARFTWCCGISLWKMWANACTVRELRGINGMCIYTIVCYWLAQFSLFNIHIAYLFIRFFPPSLSHMHIIHHISLSSQCDTHTTHFCHDIVEYDVRRATTLTQLRTSLRAVSFWTFSQFSLIWKIFVFRQREQFAKSFCAAVLHLACGGGDDGDTQPSEVGGFVLI